MDYKGNERELVNDTKQNIKPDRTKDNISEPKDTERMAKAGG